MSAKKKKRKYTFRKDQIIPYESGSLIHEGVKTARKQTKRLGFPSPSRKAKKRKI